MRRRGRRQSLDLGFHTEGSHSPQRIYTRAGGFLDRIDLFDADFFGMSPREARQVDPQHRLLLELAWEAMESAGIVPASLAGSRTGVFVGVSANDYATMIGHSPDAYTNIGSALSIAANRISYIFDLHGPSMSIDTACSSSLVALHQACRSILAGDCGMALVGGVNILGSMKPFAGFAQASMLSPDGRCKSFDADGKGYVRAEGGGVVIVKTLADAERGCRLIDVHAAPDDVARRRPWPTFAGPRRRNRDAAGRWPARYLHRTRETSIAEQTRHASFLPGARRSDESRSFRLDFLPAAASARCICARASGAPRSQGGRDRRARRWPQLPRRALDHGHAAGRGGGKGLLGADHRHGMRGRGRPAPARASRG